MTRRLQLVVVLGLVAVVAAAGFAVVAHRPAHAPAVSPTWGVYTDAQWSTLQARYGAIAMATDSPPLAIVTSRGCLVVLDGLRHLSTVCGPTAPLQVFAVHGGTLDRLVGITSPAVAYVTVTDRERGRRVTSGTFLSLAPHGHVFGSGLRRNATTLTAYDAHGKVLARVYCASALRAVCGTSAQRRS